MLFDKPLYIPNSVLIESPLSGKSGINISIDVVNKMKSLGDVVVICLMNGVCCDTNKALVIDKGDYSIYKSNRASSENLSGKLIAAGAENVFTIVSEHSEHKAALAHVFDIIGNDKPIVCISNGISIINSSVIIVPDSNDKVDLMSGNTPSKGIVYTLSEFIGKKVEYKSNKITLLDL